MIFLTRKKRRRIMVAKETRFDILEFEKMYRDNIEAHIDYEARMAGMNTHSKAINPPINPGKKYGSLREFIDGKMADYADANYGDVVLTEFGNEIKRIPSTYKPGKAFKNPEDTKKTAGSFPIAHEKKQDDNTNIQKRFR